LRIGRSRNTGREQWQQGRAGCHFGCIENETPAFVFKTFEADAASQLPQTIRQRSQTLM
jgi:hypothetical protein